jgi:hypothetical protein
MMPQPPARFNESGRQPLAQMTIAFLLDGDQRLPRQHIPAGTGARHTPKPLDTIL